MKNLLLFMLLFFSTLALAQDYILYETHYLVPDDGNQQAMAQKIKEHNEVYHKEGPHENHVFTVLNGPRTGQFFFAMGPCTFSDLDNRPSGKAHGLDWASIVALGQRVDNVQYWKLHEEMSYIPNPEDTEPSPMLRVRFYEVSDYDTFVEIEEKIVAVFAEMGVERPRAMYIRQFNQRDDWYAASVKPYDNWAELDKKWEGPKFKETFIKLYGEEDWETFKDDYDNTILDKEDEWRQRL